MNKSKELLKTKLAVTIELILSSVMLWILAVYTNEELYWGTAGLVLYMIAILVSFITAFWIIYFLISKFKRVEFSTIALWLDIIVLIGFVCTFIYDAFISTDGWAGLWAIVGGIGFGIPLLLILLGILIYKWHKTTKMVKDGLEK